mgnify:CR=1 FL=1
MKRAMNYSKQRETILKVLRENMNHPTADRLYELVRRELSDISLATVYRNLNRLAAAGVILSVRGLDGSVHFDHNVEKHYHFICTKCNKVYDIPHDVTPDLAVRLLEKTGMETESYDIVFKGICHNCKSVN